MDTKASFKTQRAGRYLTALCHHFGRKVAAECDAYTGWVQFPFGRCELIANDTSLEFVASADDRMHLVKVERIITSHFERFAFRENPHLDWRAPSPSGPTF